MTTLINRNGFYVNVSVNYPKRTEDKIKYIIDEISKVSGYPKNIIISETRKEEVRVWRQIGMYITKRNTTATWSFIGKCYGNRNHATCINAYERISDLIDSNDSLVVDKLKQLKHLKYL